MIFNLLSQVTLFVKNVFDFLVKMTGSTTMAYVSLILVGALAIALVVFTILATIGSCKRKKTAKKSSCEQINETPNTFETTEVVEESAPTSDENSENTTHGEKETQEPNEKTTHKDETPESSESAIKNSTDNNSEIAPTSEQPIETNDKPTVQSKPRRPYDDVPAMPIYRKSKYEKPKTILVKKDKSKLRNPESK